MQAIMGEGYIACGESKNNNKTNKSRSAFHVPHVLAILNNASEKVVLPSGWPAPTAASPTWVFH